MEASRGDIIFCYTDPSPGVNLEIIYKNVLHDIGLVITVCDKSSYQADVFC